MDDASGAMRDVMRGEETQIVGALALSKQADGLFLLPGTHSKWVRVRAGRIDGFSTYMTGEIYAACREHTILGRLMQEGHDPAAFARGVRDGAKPGAAGALLHRLFGVRTAGLFGEIAGSGLADYLSGLLIGAEFADAAVDRAANVTIIAADDLARRYQAAAQELGVDHRACARRLRRRRALCHCAPRGADRCGNCAVMSLDAAMAVLPLVAILRGIGPEEAEAVGAALVGAGFRIIEVPLNSPEPLRSIETLSKRFGTDALIGAGTVMTPADVTQVVAAGGRLIVMPHGDAEVIRAAKAAGAWCLPGVATPTEAFAALKAGADALKLFPGEALPPAVVKAWKAVLPKAARLLPVGGIAPETMARYVAAGAAGFGIGSALYKAGMTASEVAERADAFVVAWRGISG